MSTPYKDVNQMRGVHLIGMHKWIYSSIYSRLYHLGLQLCRVYVHPVQAILPFCLIHVLLSIRPQVIKSFGILQQQKSQGDQQTMSQMWHCLDTFRVTVSIAA